MVVAELLRRQDSAYSNPGLARQAEQEARLLDDNSIKIQALFKHLVGIDMHKGDGWLQNDMTYVMICDHQRLEDTVQLDRCLGRAGKSPECLVKAPEGGPKSVQHLAATCTAPPARRSANHAKPLKASQVDAIRKELESLIAEETLDKMKAVFESYCNKKYLCMTGKHELDIVGFCRLLRDTRLLDSRLTLVQADVLFTRVDANANENTIPKDLLLDYDQFHRCLRRIVKIKYPLANNIDEGLITLIKTWILPLNRGTAELKPVDALFTRSSINLIRKHDAQLRRIFSWYATLEETDPQRITWEYVRAHHLTIGRAEFVLMLLNFQVVPALMAKHEALEVHTKYQRENGASEKHDAQSYAAFLETLACTSIFIVDHMRSRITDCTSPDHWHLLKRFVDCCDGSIHNSLLQVFNAIMAERGRLQEGGFVSANYQTQIDAMRRRAEQLEQDDALNSRITVVMRREDTRQKFALTRLRNFYKDVRTANNNTTWPPPEDEEAAAAAAAGGHAGENPVSFFVDQRHIKTPKLANEIAAVAPTPLPRSMHEQMEMALGLDKADIIPYVTSVIYSPFNAGGRSPAAANFIRQSKQHLAPIEDREETESILQLAQKLPSLVEPAAAAGAGDDAEHDVDAVDDEFHDQLLQRVAEEQEGSTHVPGTTHALGVATRQPPAAKDGEVHSRKLPPLPSSSSSRGAQVDCNQPKHPPAHQGRLVASPPSSQGSQLKQRALANKLEAIQDLRDVQNLDRFDDCPQCNTLNYTDVAGTAQPCIAAPATAVVLAV